jgi:hypothetical protein
MLDGTMCGAFGDQWYCQPPSGAEVTSGPLPITFGDACANKGVLDDGVVMSVMGDLGNNLSMYRLEASGAATVVAAVGPFRPIYTRYGADGSAWAVMVNQTSVVIGRFSRNGDFDATTSFMTSTDDIFGGFTELMVGREQVVFRSRNKFTRVPRPR